MMKKVFLFIFIYFLFIPAAFSAQDRGPLLHKSSKAKEKKWDTLKKELQGRRNPLTSKVIQRRLDRIYRSMAAKNGEDKTLALINSMEKIVKKRPAELARLYKLKAQVYLGKDSYKQAFSYYKRALNLKVLPLREHLSILYDQTTLYMIQNKINTAAQMTDQLFYLNAKISPSLYMLKAFVLLEQNKKKQALKMVSLAISSTNHPKESWLSVGAALNIDLEKYPEAARLLMQLTNSYPDKKKYWKQLASVYLNIGKDDRSLATLDLAYKLDFLEKEQEIVHLATLLMYQGFPLKAARLLEKSLKIKKIKPTQKNYESLGDCWMRAEEMKKALAAFQKSAPLAKDGRVFVKIGQIYMQNREWVNAIEYFKKAIDKGQIKYLEYVYIYIGRAYLELKKYYLALEFFTKVSDTKARGQIIKNARELINYTNKLIQQNEL